MTEQVGSHNEAVQGRHARQIQVRDRTNTPC